MMGCTDRHQRYFMRRISRHARLYSEMLTADAVIHGDRQRLLGFDASESPLALQLGGSDPEKLAQAAGIGAQWGYDEINLNVGCPSERVQSGSFGACLMQQPELVAACVDSMREQVDVPVTVKCRIGVDEQDPYQMLPAFIETVVQAGCEIFIIHARKAILAGLSPRENREIPPLDYPLVQAMKAAYPQLTIVINGGIQSLAETEVHLDTVDGVMIGRAAYANPWMLADADTRLFGTQGDVPCPYRLVEQMYDYIEQELTRGTPLLTVIKPMIPLFQGVPGARAWRRHLSEQAHRPGADLRIVEQALSFVSGNSALAAA